MGQKFRAAPESIALSEEHEKLPSRVQLLRTGSFSHPVYGQFEITKEHLLAFKENHEANTRGIDLAIDYAHESDKEAAAWIKALELADTQNGVALYAHVEWTPDGAEAVIKKKYRYLSAEFTLNYQHNESLKEHGPTLLGAGLTNRPVIKDMDPVIELSESEENKMDKDAKIAELEAKLSEVQAQVEAKEGELTEAKAKIEENEKAAQAADEEKKLSEKKARFDVMLSEGKSVEAQRDSFMSGDLEKFAELAQAINLSEKGNSVEPPKTEEPKDLDAKIIELAEKLVETKEVKTLSEGISKVLRENEELRKEKYSN